MFVKGEGRGGDEDIDILVIVWCSVELKFCRSGGGED